MFEAHIVSPRGSLYYASDCTTYDLETVRQHLRDAVPDVLLGDVELEIVIDDGADEARVTAWCSHFGRVVSQFDSRRLDPVRDTR